jgi:hypothetical protein
MPKDLGVKVTTKEGVQWEQIVEAQESAIINSKINTEIAEYLVELAKKRAKEEKEKFQKE